MPTGTNRHWRGGAVGLLALGMLTLAGCFGGKAVEPPLAGGTPSAECARCHGAIYREWQQSAHAAAFTREEFKVASRGHKQEDCLRCHVPQSLDQLSDAPVRTAHRDEGVNCESCHLSSHAYAAPKQFSSYAEHPVVENELLTKSDFCGKCHKAVFQQWSEAPVPADERKTCQECHMPLVRRKTVSGSIWHLLHPTVEVRKHMDARPAPTPGHPNIAMSLAVDEATAGAVCGSVTLTNMVAQHSLPAGEYGFREIAVIVTLLDRYGVASAKHIDRFVAQKRILLPYREPQVLTFRFEPVPADAQTLRVQLVRSSYAGVQEVIAEEERPLRSPADTGRLARGEG